MEVLLTQLKNFLAQPGQKITPVPLAALTPPAPLTFPVLQVLPVSEAPLAPPPPPDFSKKPIKKPSPAKGTKHIKKQKSKLQKPVKPNVDSSKIFEQIKKKEFTLKKTVKPKADTNKAFLKTLLEKLKHKAQNKRNKSLTNSSQQKIKKKYIIQQAQEGKGQQDISRSILLKKVVEILAPETNSSM